MNRRHVESVTPRPSRATGRHPGPRGGMRIMRTERGRRRASWPTGSVNLGPRDFHRRPARAPPPPRRRNPSGSYLRVRGGGLQGCPVGLLVLERCADPRATAGGPAAASARTRGRLRSGAAREFATRPTCADVKPAASPRPGRPPRTADAPLRRRTRRPRTAPEVEYQTRNPRKHCGTSASRGPGSPRVRSAG